MLIFADEEPGLVHMDIEEGEHSQVQGYFISLLTLGSSSLR